MGALEDFAAQLAAEPDEKKREALISRLKFKAAQQAPDNGDAPNSTIMRDYLAQDIALPPSLVYPTIAVRGEITVTLGRAGKGKTTVNANRIISWAAGRALFPDWVDQNGVPFLSPEKPLRTLIAENEGNASMFHGKMKTRMYEGPLTDEERELALDNLFVYGDGGYSGLKLDNKAGVDVLRREIELREPDIVFLEPFRSLWSGEENSATDMAKVIDNMHILATEYNCAVILSHHERKSGAGDDGEKMSAGRGSTVLEGAAAVMENFESVKGGDFRELSWSKARYMVPPPPVRLEYDRVSDWYNWVPQDAIDDAIIRALSEADDEPLNMAALMELLDESKSKLDKHIKRLVDEKRVKRMASVASGSGSTGFRYRLPTGDNDSAGEGLSL